MISSTMKNSICFVSARWHGSVRKRTVFDKMPNLFGPVNRKFRFSKDSKCLDVWFDDRWGRKPRTINLHIRSLADFFGLSMNGGCYSKKETVEPRGS
jgi:hypothetical protein